MYEEGLHTFLKMSVVYLPSKLTDQLYILQNTSFPEKVTFRDVAH